MILPMLELLVVGPRARLPEALAFLQARGVLELAARPPQAAGGAPLAPLPTEPADEALEPRLEEAVARCDRVLARLPAPAPGRAAGALPDPSAPAFAPAAAALEAGLDSLEAARAALAEERQRVETLSRLVVAVAPLEHGLDEALAPELHALVLKRDPLALSLLEAQVRELTGGACAVDSRELPDGQVGVLLVVPRARGREVGGLLRERGVEEVRLPEALAGRSLVEGLLAVAARERALPAEQAALEATLADLAAEAGPALRAARASAEGALARLRAARRCGATAHAFVVEGWLPAERLEALSAAAAATFGGEVVLAARAPPPTRWDEVPVVLRNRPAIRPFERLLGLVPLPRYGSIDPTPFLAVSFPLLFGLVLGDVAFGVLATGVALLARRRGWGGPVGRDLAWVALWCAAAAALFGLAFGEALGELGATLGLHPLLLDRRRALLDFLGVAVATGLLHVGAGAVLGVAAAARQRAWRHAAARLGKLLLLLGGAGAAAGALGLLGAAPRWPALVVLGAGLAAALAAEGPLAALDLVLGLGQVLSYARLMALGLASALLAEVANGLAVALPGAGGLALAVLLHAVNFTLCLVSPVVAALRLHYVEFFERFYEAGGAPFRPFALPAP